MAILDTVYSVRSSYVAFAALPNTATDDVQYLTHCPTAWTTLVRSGVFQEDHHLRTHASRGSLLLQPGASWREATMTRPRDVDVECIVGLTTELELLFFSLTVPCITRAQIIDYGVDSFWKSSNRGVRSACMWGDSIPCKVMQCLLLFTLPTLRLTADIKSFDFHFRNLLRRWSLLASDS